MHNPGPTNVIVAPFTPPAVHTAGVVVENDTGNPDVTVADTTTGDSDNNLSDNAANVIV